MTARELMREKGTPAPELGLPDEGTIDTAIIDAMLTHPILVNRPTGITLALLVQRPESFTKEDGEVGKL